MQRTILLLATLLAASPALAQSNAEQAKPGETAVGAQPAGRPSSETPVPPPEVVTPDVLPPPAASVQPDGKDAAAKTPADPKK